MTTSYGAGKPGNRFGPQPASHGTEEPQAAVTPSSTQEPTRYEQGTSMTESQAPRPIPTMGWPKFRYWLARTLKGDDARVPALGKKERRLLEAQQAEEQRRLTAHKAELERIENFKDSIQALNDLTDETQSGTFVFINTKGAAAVTTSLVNAACTLGKYTQVVSIVFDGNPAEGTSAARLGKDYNKTITVQQLHSNLEELKTNFKAFIRKVRPNKYFVRCISANPVVQGDNPLLAPAELDSILEVTQQNCEYLLVDTPNVITDAMGLTMIRRADVLVFTANVAVADSLRRLGTSMQSLRNNGLQDLVDHSVVVISNIQVGDDAQNYRTYLNLMNLKNEIFEQLEGQFHGTFVGVRHDPEIARDGIVDMEAWQTETDADYRNVVYSMLMQLKAAQERHPATSAKAIQPAPQEQAIHQNGHLQTEGVLTTQHQGGTES